MKKILHFLILFCLSFYIFSQNFLIENKETPNLYSTIDLCTFSKNTITFDYEIDLPQKIITYKEVHKNGLLFFEMPEKFPKQFNEDFLHGKDITTSNDLLILAGNQKNHKVIRRGEEVIYDFILMIAATESMDSPYPFIFPTWGLFEVYNTQYYDCSSFLVEKNTVYKVENLHDLGMDTPWVENAKGSGIGEGFTIHNVTYYPYLLIMNGYISYKKPHLYKMNNRVKKLKVTGLKSGKSKILDVLDTPHPQTVDISFITENEDLRIEIADVYKGSKYDDTCIHYLINYEDEVIPYENSIPD